MLKPSYAELMDVLNEHSEGKDINSRYTIVIAAAKRARQLIDGDEPMIENYNSGKPVSTAVEELYENKIQIVPEGHGTVLELYKKPEQEVKEELEQAKAEAKAEAEAEVSENTTEESSELQDLIADDSDVDEMIDFDDDEDEG